MKDIKLDVIENHLGNIKIGTNEFKHETASLLQSASNFIVLKKRIIATANELGFSDVDISVVKNDEYVGFLASTLPQSLHDDYYNEQLYLNDPILGHLSYGNESVFDGDAYDYFINCPYTNAPFAMQCRKIKALLASYHFQGSYTIPVVEKNTNTRFLFAVMDKHTGVDQFKKLISYQKQCLEAFASITCKLLAFRNHTAALVESGVPDLTQRQITILDLLSSLPAAQSQVADIIGQSKSTIEKDIKDIKDKLGTNNLYQCVRIAMTLKLIH